MSRTICCIKTFDGFPNRILCWRTFFLLFSILIFPITLLIFLCFNVHTFCKYGLHCLHYEFWDYHFWFRTKVMKEERVSESITTITRRYMKEPPLKTYWQLKQKIVTNPHINQILQSVNDGIPNFFFHVELSGSLSERFGKPFPSFSILASDYDCMLVPSRLTVYIENSTKEKDSEPDPLYARNDVCDRQKKDQPYYWIKLSEESHFRYLGESCLHFHKEIINSTAEYFISSALIKPKIRKYIKKITDKKEEMIVHIDTGPAVNVKYEKEKLDLDITLALPCQYWPDQTIEWFNRDHHWIGAKEEYDYKTRLREVGLHFVPKESLSFMEEILLHKPMSYTTENKTKYPSLEWRLSFSLPELILSNHVPEMVRWAYMILKSIVKRKQKKMKTKKFASYFLKNTLFWFLDDLDKQTCRELHEVKLPLPDSKDFDEAKFEDKMWFVMNGLVAKLLHFLEDKKVPHYWWNGDKYNLLQKVPNSILTKFQKLLLKFLSSRKEACIIMSDMEADMQLANMELKKRGNGCCFTTRGETWFQPVKRRFVDKYEELKKFIYSRGRIGDTGIFKARNCLPCGECTCCGDNCCITMDRNFSIGKEY